MTLIGKTVRAVADLVLRLVVRPRPGTRYRCADCGARVGQRCADPFCYGSLTDEPAG